MNEYERRAKAFQEVAHSNRLRLGPVCLVGGEPIFFVPGRYAVVPGHIYSDAGVREFRITQQCEFHFDLDFAKKADVPERGWEILEAWRNGES
jgi:hypothetical protein